MTPQAVYLWGYHVSGFAPLLERAQAALGIMMAGYPAKWIPTSNGIAMQRARIILPLAFLVRANDTALHRQWLRTAVDGLLTRCAAQLSWDSAVTAPQPLCRACAARLLAHTTTCLSRHRA